VVKFCIIAAPVLLVGIVTQSAHAAECPVDQVRADVSIEGPNTSTGVEVLNEVAIPLEGSTGLAGVLQHRRVTIEPGGTLELHRHDVVPGFAYVLTGTAIEYRSDCSVPIVRTGGDIATEPSSLTHWWRNEGETPVVLLVSHVVRDGAE